MKFVWWLLHRHNTQTQQMRRRTRFGSRLRYITLIIYPKIYSNAGAVIMSWFNNNCDRNPTVGISSVFNRKSLLWASKPGLSRFTACNKLKHAMLHQWVELTLVLLQIVALETLLNNIGIKNAVFKSLLKPCSSCSDKLKATNGEIVVEVRAPEK